MVVLNFGHRQVHIFGTEMAKPLPVIWLQTFDGAEAAKVYEQLDGSCVLLAVSGCQWERDFTPWPAPAVDKRAVAFSGEAEAYLRLLTENIMPDTESRLPFTVEKRGIAGYSLAGLFSLYAACRCLLFQGVASISGSLWYDGWSAWAEAHPPLGTKRQPFVYLSLGDRESQSKNTRLQQNDVALQAVIKAWQTRTSLFWEMNKGGHFQEPEAQNSQRYYLAKS